MDQPGNAFYLTPLLKPKGDVWFSLGFSKVPLGHNRLGQVVPELMKKSGFLRGTIIASVIGYPTI